MKTLNPREATLRDQFRQKLVDSSRNVYSEADLLQLAVEVRLEQGFPRSLSERNFCPTDHTGCESQDNPPQRDERDVLVRGQAISLRGHRTIPGAHRQLLPLAEGI